MNIHTERIDTELNKTHEPLTGKEQTNSQEYYSLAILKSLFPKEYIDLEKKIEDRPDLRSSNDTFGVEVTTADSYTDNQDSRELSKYVKDRDKRRIKTIESHNKKVFEVYGITTVQSGGGYHVDEDKQLLIKCIKDKIKSAKRYASSFKGLELVILKQELVPSIWAEGIFNYIDEALYREDCVFETIYVIYQDKCYCYKLNGNREIKTIDNVIRLKLLGYLSAKGIIKYGDKEWQE